MLLVSIKIGVLKLKTIANVRLDGWLFGENLEDRLKEVKQIEKSRTDLKTTWSSISIQGSSAEELQDNERKEVLLPGSVLNSKEYSEVRFSAGRISKFINEWFKITKDGQILSWVEGYKIPMKYKVKQKIIYFNNLFHTHKK